MFRRYSVAEDLVRNADERKASAETQLRQVSRERDQLKAIQEKGASAAAQRNSVIDSITPKMLAETATDGEIAELARAINDTPAQVIDLPGIPPDKVLRGWRRIRVDGQIRAYVLVAAQIDGKWRLHSVLVRSSDKSVTSP
jgi:hypothetical protein